jgi:hypothetical protein
MQDTLTDACALIHPRLCFIGRMCSALSYPCAHLPMRRGSCLLEVGRAIQLSVDERSKTIKLLLALSPLSVWQAACHS